MPLKIIFPNPILLLLFCLPPGLKAQLLEFIQDPDLLNPVTGFVDYADCSVDMNGDYLDDVVRVGSKGIYIDYQQKNGRFSQKFFNLFIDVLPTWSICAGDLDNDGFNDLLFASSSGVSFVKAHDAGTSYTEDVMPVTIASQRSTMADINNDGWLDAFVCNDTAQSIPFRNNAAGNMIPDNNLIKTSRHPGSYAAIWTDYDADHDIDLYITKCKGGAPPTDSARINLMYRNNSDGTFTEVAAELGLNDNAQSWSTSFEDFDNDGDMDAFIVNHDFQNRLFRNNNNGTFTDVIHVSGINPNDLGAFENSTGDFNNDGFIDIFSDLQQRLYLGNGDMTFTAQMLPMIPGAIADLNDDGFLDVMMRGRPWINQGNDNHYVKISTRGIESNRNGIGSRIEIYGSWGVQVREVRSGQSYSPMSSLNTHFGTGESTTVDSLVIKWPSGIITILTNLKADTSYIIPEAECVLPSVDLSIKKDTSICEGSSFLVSAPSGFAAYLWQNNSVDDNILVDTPGVFSVIVTDSSGCISVSNSIRVNFIEETVPVITSLRGNHICEGDTITLLASDGINYNWSNGVSGQKSIQVTQTGAYTVSVESVCHHGQIESAPFVVNVIPSPEPIVSGWTVEAGDSVLISAIGENLHWYDLPVGGMLLAAGSEFQTSAITSDTIFYVEAHNLLPGETQQGGKPDTSGAGGLPSQVGALLFESWEPFTLLSVKVYLPPGAPAGIRFVQLVSGDSLLFSKPFTVVAGWNELDLNWSIPVGMFSLRSPQGNLFRNAGSLSYPYPIGRVGQITTSSFGDDYYYFFYDWKIRTPVYECISDRVPVEILITSLNDPLENFDWKIYPNPASTFIQIEFPENISGDISIRDVTGRIILFGLIDNADKLQMDLLKFSAGIYYIEFLHSGRVESAKLIVQ